MAFSLLRLDVGHADHLEAVRTIGAAGVGTTGSRGRVVVLGGPAALRRLRRRAARRRARRRGCVRPGALVVGIVGIAGVPHFLRGTRISITAVYPHD